MPFDFTARTARQALWLGALGLVLLVRGDRVTIGAVERYITDTAWERGWVEPFLDRAAGGLKDVLWQSVQLDAGADERSIFSDAIGRRFR